MRDIPGYEGLYAATSCGRIWSYRAKKFLKPAKTKDGYLKLSLCKDGKRKNYRIHRLIAKTYLPNPTGLPEVNHIDEDKTNNALPNLEWCTAAYNVRYSQAKKVQCIETGQVFESAREAQDFFKCGHTVASVCKGKRKTAAGYHWRYYEENEKEEI